ncbi:MAG: nucleoside kinase [Deltaproteobacteria bacterium]|nr:nucleoside kinase [Deltaproteobacteria bacterium]
MLSRSVKIALGDRTLAVPAGTEVRALRPPFTPGSLGEPLAAVYNNRLVSLSYKLRSGGTLGWVTLADRAGWDVYRRTASMMLYEAGRRLDPALRFLQRQTHGDALYYEVEGPGQEPGDGPRPGLSPERCAALEAEMRALSRENLPIIVHGISVEEARELLREQGCPDKAFLLRTHWETSVQIVSCGGLVDLFHYPLADATGIVRSFRLTPYEAGLLLRVPVRGQTAVRGRPRVGRKLFEVHRDSRAWSRRLGVSNLAELNGLSVSGGVEDLIRVAEGGHEKRIASIADRIARTPGVRLVLCAGPSSSGKTTFIKRLDVQLRVGGICPVSLSVDDFFVPRECTPKDARGRHDFECLEAIDLGLFNEVLADLLGRGEARVPHYDFELGRPTERECWRTLRLEPDQVLLIEGMHALNPALTLAVPTRHKYKAYISALTQLSVDDHHRIFTSDTRLLRRIVRDRRYRGYSAAETIRRWPSVRRGEMRHIFPFQEQADIIFNSALVYEHAVLRNYVERYLLEIDEREEEFQEAFRLLGFLRRVVPILPDAVPQNSILREFIGDSAFKYR